MQTSEPLTVLEALGEEEFALRLDCSGDNHRVVPRKPALGLQAQSLRIIANV